MEQSYRFGFHRLGSVLVVSVLVGLATIGGLIFAPDDGGTIVTVVHAGLPAADTEQHHLGWAHFLDRLLIAAAGGDPGPDPWAAAPPGPPSG